MLCNMSPEKLLEVVQNCPASMLQKFVLNVTASIAAAVVSIPTSLILSRVWVSLIMTPFVCITDFVVGRITLTFQNLAIRIDDC